MQNKVLVEIIVPDIDRRFEIFIPINKKIGNIIILLEKAIKEIDDRYTKSGNSLYNRDTGFRYQVDIIVYNTDIRNGTSLILI